MKRSALRRSAGLRMGAGLRARSARRKPADEQWRAVRDGVLRRRNYRCEMRDRTCWGPVDVHHVHPVGRGGPRLDPMNLAVLCRKHHGWVHDHPVEARDMGLLA